MDGPFAGQAAIVTGASSGIGYELARQLAEGGARVGLIARRIELLEELQARIRASGGIAAVQAADVGSFDATRAAVHKIRAELGPIDLMIANAGVGRSTRINPVNLADVTAIFQVNLLGVIHAFTAVQAEMLQRRHGRLVAIFSLAGYKGLPGESAYCASKAAVNVYLDGLRVQLRHTGVKVTTVCPGFVRTPMTERDAVHPWRLEADEAARRILRAIRRGAKIYSFPWPTLCLMRLIGLLPDWLLAKGMQSYNEEQDERTKAERC